MITEAGKIFFQGGLFKRFAVNVSLVVCFTSSAFFLLTSI